MGNCSSSEPQIHTSDNDRTNPRRTSTSTTPTNMTKQNHPTHSRKKKSSDSDSLSFISSSSMKNHRDTLKPVAFAAATSSSLTTAIHAFSTDTDVDTHNSTMSSTMDLWQSLYSKYQHQIVDPQDIPSILDAAFSSTIYNLHSAEMTLILRRVRKVVITTTNLTTMANTSYSNNNNSNNNNTTTTTTTSSSVASTSAISNTMANMDIHGTNVNMNTNTTLEELKKFSRNTYQKDHLLDEYMIRQIFMAGDRWMSQGYTFHWMRKSWEEYQLRKRNQDAQQQDYHPHDHDKRMKFPKTVASSTSLPSDLIGSAYILMLYLSESRWDHVAQIASFSAKKVGLDLDVNHQPLSNEKKSASSRNVPIPPPLIWNAETYDMPDVYIPTLENGVSIPSLTYIISLALRGSRKQRLTLLFYLLLDTKLLMELLEMHPAGGIPSWLIELDQDWILSYAGLSHYLYYERVLKVNAWKAIETISIMLSYLLPETYSDSKKVAHHNSGGSNMAMIGNRKRALSYGDTKYHAAKMHLMLADYLYRVRTEEDYPTFENVTEQQKRIQFLDQFWDVCSDEFFNDRESEKFLNLSQFLSWADRALPSDAVLDVIMHQVFGMGLLPTPAMERQLVTESWLDWQSKALNSAHRHGSDLNHWSTVWGGIGGFDGYGGLGYGIMYCVDKEWWDHWQRYVGWDNTSDNRNRLRPHELSSEKLLDRSPESSVTGSLGSYELMKVGLRKGIDYVLIPPGAWDILYELYGGGPPLPRMISKPIHSTANSANIFSDVPVKVPSLLNVVTHPWVLECHVCDPHQPYRRGDAGHMSIRLMASPEQPLYRMLSEIILRLPIVHPRGKDSDGKGRARLWREVNRDEDENQNNSSFGPWVLLKERSTVEFPVGENFVMDESNYDFFLTSWKNYADNASLESIGIMNGMRLMFEYALVGKDGKFTWPRETAAKAGKILKDNAEDVNFRTMLRGLNKDGSHISIVGTVVDAMDSSGRWFQAEIVETQSHSTSDDSSYDDFELSDNDTDDETLESLSEIKSVKIDFTEVGGHEEWLSVTSDRLAVKGRFTLDSMKSIDQNESNSSQKQGNGEQKSFGAIILKKRTTKEAPVFRLGENICSFPGFGACGLSNLGNTCYINAALQCIFYIPLLRSYLISNRFKKYDDINKMNPLGSGGKLLEEIAALQGIVWSGKYGVRHPLRFRNQLSRSLSQYATNEQQDAQEFLNDILDIMHEDSNKVMKKPYVAALEDRWVDQTELYRVGEETWRRFLRRNRSIVSNIGMGQVLNRVSCPVCNYTSHNFDPFNMLSIPFPVLSDVVFTCKVLRRADSRNRPKILSAGEYQSHTDLEGCDLSRRHLLDEYVVTLPRLADISDLKHKLNELCEISLNRMKIYVTADVFEINEKKSDTDVKFIELVELPEKEGPCLQYAKANVPGEFLSPYDLPTSIFVFESTLMPRRNENKYSNYNREEEEEELNRDIIQGDVVLYGDSSECRLFDTLPTNIAKVISRLLMPKSIDDVFMGMRVDAIDQKGQWFPGSIVEILPFINDDDPLNQKIRIHFDNYATKWDLAYTIHDITKGKIQPLYTHSVPKEIPIEILAHHSSNDDSSGLFGTPFSLQFFTEWTFARAGAHVLAQASRFLNENDEQYETNAALSKAIDVLVDADREYINTILSSPLKDKSDSLSLRRQLQVLKERLEISLCHLSDKMPFEILICDSMIYNEKDKETYKKFEYHLDHIIGNSITTNMGIVLEWKSITKNGIATFFQAPHPVTHTSKDLDLPENRSKSMHKKEMKYSHGGLPLSVCLHEFCNEQNLSSDDCWRCPKCNEFREGRQSMKLWRLPDILTFHLKRFNCSAKWREKITTKINFPLTGLDMKEWCDKDSAALHSTEDSYVYDLIGVVNHHGGMTGGHYVAFCKATACSQEGSEEVEHNFTGAGVHAFGGGNGEKESPSSVWRLGRSKDKDSTTILNKAAQLASKAVAEGSEPLWLQFDDESVEPIPPRCVNSENAYVLFYRKRRISPYNIARYSSME